MNIIELGFFMTPIVGAIGGATVTKGAGTIAVVSAIAVGVVVGIGLLALMRLTFRVWPSRLNLKHPEWLGPLLAVFVLPIALPISAYFLSRVIVLAGLHL